MYIAVTEETMSTKDRGWDLELCMEVVLIVTDIHQFGN